MLAEKLSFPDIETFALGEQWFQIRDLKRRHVHESIHTHNGLSYRTACGRLCDEKKKLLVPSESLENGVPPVELSCNNCMRIYYNSRIVPVPQEEISADASFALGQRWFTVGNGRSAHTDRHSVRRAACGLLLIQSKLFSVASDSIPTTACPRCVRVVRAQLKETEKEFAASASQATEPEPHVELELLLPEQPIIDAILLDLPELTAEIADTDPPNAALELTPADVELPAKPRLTAQPEFTAQPELTAQPKLTAEPESTADADDKVYGARRRETLYRDTSRYRRAAVVAKKDSYWFDNSDDELNDTDDEATAEILNGIGGIRFLPLEMLQRTQLGSFPFYFLSVEGSKLVHESILSNPGQAACELETEIKSVHYFRSLDEALELGCEPCAACFSEPERISESVDFPE